MASSSRTLAVPRSVFVRPSNMWLSHPLQSLQILSYMARSSGGRVLRFRAPREVDQQRMLNFATITYETPDLAAAACKSAHRLRVPFNSRMACDYTSLLTRGVLDDRGIGLEEIAPLVDLDLGITSGHEATAHDPDAHANVKGAKNGNGHHTILASVREPVHQNVFEVEMKLERRSEPDSLYRPMSLPGIRSVKRDKEHYKMLREAVEKFKGFGETLDASAFDEPGENSAQPRARRIRPDSSRESKYQPLRNEDKWST